MKISIIVAADMENGIGYMGEIPWHIPEDLKRFKELTMGHHILVGRITWDSINKPLKGRKVIVVTRDPSGYAPTHTPDLITDDIVKAVVYAEKNNEQELFVAGGSRVYRETMYLADSIYLTRIKDKFYCDSFFPDINYSEWRVVEGEVSNHEGIEFVFEKLERIQPRIENCSGF